MPKKPPLTRALIGPSGEHFVLSRLYQHGVLAALAPPGTPEVDILVLSPDADSIAATVQVKTSTGGARSGWQFKSKHETITASRLFYALVDFRASPPTTYVLPSRVVAKAVKLSHLIWLSEPRRDGNPHKDNPLRQVKAKYPFKIEGFEEGWLDEWKERWDLIVAEAEEA